MTFREYIPLLSLALAASACSVDDTVEAAPDGSEDALETHRTGLIVADFERDQTVVHGQFLDLYGISSETALSALDVWLPDPELTLDACSLRAPEAGQAHHGFQINLLDVGPITIAFEDASVQLQGRRLPDLVRGVSGVVYGSEQGYEFDGVDVPHHPNLMYTVSAPGSADAGGFTEQIEAPEIPTLVGYAGAVSSSPDVDLEALEYGRDLELRWIEASSGQGSALYLDVSAVNSSNTLRLACRLEDDGVFLIPGNVISQLAEDLDQLDITLRRIRGVDVHLEGLDQTELLFAATSRATVEIYD